VAHSFTLIMLAAVAAPGVQQHIDHIQHRLLPPVLVTGESPQTAELAARMAELHVPGVSVAVIHAGKLEWARGFGVARLGGPPVTPETLFQAASISKPVFATAVMSLVQAGKLNLDTDVNQYLKTWKVPENEYTREAHVNLGQLLSHSAGVTVHGFEGYAAGAPLPTLVQVLDGTPPANSAPIRVATKPGTEFSYSGGGFVIAQQLVIDVTGEPLPVLMHDKVLAPFGMRHSTYEQPLPADRLAQVAMPYRPDGSEVPGGPHVYPELVAAGLWTTPSDLANFAIGIQQALAGKSQRVLSAATARAMLVPGSAGHQAIGLRTLGGPEHLFFTHSGGNEGYRCDLVAYQQGDGVVVMTNGDNGGPVIEEIVRTVAHEYAWPDFQPPTRTLAKVDPVALDHVVGAYILPSGNIAVFWREGDHFDSRLWGEPVVELFPQSPTEYFAKDVDALWHFEPAAGQATLSQFGFDRTAKAMNAADTEVAVAASVAITKRFKEQSPDPRGEVLLRRHIVSVAKGAPEYGDMVEPLAKVVRESLPWVQKALAPLGEIQSVSFLQVGPAGDDHYKVTFANGSRGFTIILDPKGVLHTVRLEQ
jgi:CubicO group peptidase (beta-lactamase class C family)